ncbi:MAG TPA: hypothetical protein VHC22_29425 [Pirellulales bacterium]|nr:hypothetical protein [Pirellulales bacterium]
MPTQLVVMPKQFSLRLMLTVVTAVCVALGVWIVPAERQRRAVAAIEAAGGGVRYVSRDSVAGETFPIALLRRRLPRDYFDDVCGVRLTSSSDLLDTMRITDDVLTHLEPLRKLRRLPLNYTRITDAGLVHLQGLTKLRWLWLDNTQVTDAGLVHLQALTSLTNLSLYRTQATEDGVARLQKTLPKCRISLDGLLARIGKGR